MKHIHVLSRWFSPLVWLLALAPASFCRAATPTPVLTVRESEAALYARQEADSDKIATLQKGEMLAPLAEAVGQQTWYMVKTQRGLVGWVRATDVSGEDQLRASFKDQQSKEQKFSIWNAQTDAGRIFEGGWTLDPASSPDKASGTWTLGEGGNPVLLRGTWAAQKFSTGWSGTWRAAVESQRREFTGSWTADFPKGREASMDELFLTAARDAIRGVWNAGNESGSWVIRAGN